MRKTCCLLSWDNNQVSKRVPPACSLSDIESTSFIKQEATAFLLINQLRSCSLLWWSLHVLLDFCSLLTRDATVEHAPRPAFSEESMSERALFREILLNARLLCCRVVSVRAVRVGVILDGATRREADARKGESEHHVIQSNVQTCRRLSRPFSSSPQQYQRCLPARP
jgi:hypothetical protein